MGNTSSRKRRTLVWHIVCFHSYTILPSGTTVMSLTPHFGPPFSPQLSPALAPIETLEHRQNSSSSESSSRTVMPVTRSYPQENVLAAQDATPLRRYRDSQKHKKTRSRLTGLATPFHVDTRRRPQGVLLPMRLPSRILRSKGHQRLTNVDTVSNKSTIVRSLTHTFP